MGYSFDAEYVRRLAEGDAMVEEHFLAYFGRLLNIKLRRKLRHGDEIEDARQETFARVLSTLREGEGVRDPCRLGGFVNSVCENVLRELARKVKRMPLASAPAPDRADPGDRVDSELVRGEVVELVRQVLEELPADDRALLREVFLEERDRDEICRRHQVNREYLRVLLHRAKGRFRQRYDNSIARQARAGRGKLATGGPRPSAAD
jgi:RNA polymerase sigma-70 factor (ECF subfamily)